MTNVAERLDERLSEPSTDRTGGDAIRGMWAWTVLRLLLGWSFLWALSAR